MYRFAPYDIVLCAACVTTYPATPNPCLPEKGEKPSGYCKKLNMWRRGRGLDA